MANLMVIRVDDEGEAVLIVTHQDGVTPMGFATQMTFEDFLERPLSIEGCLRSSNGISNPSRGFSESKSGQQIYIDTSIEWRRDRRRHRRAAAFPRL